MSRGLLHRKGDNVSEHEVYFVAGRSRHVQDARAPRCCQISACFLLGWTNSILNTLKAVQNIHYRHFDGFYKSENAVASWTTCQLRD